MDLLEYGDAVQIKYDLPLPEVLKEGEEWLCLSKASFMWKDDDFICPRANPTYSSKYTPKREEAIGKRVSHRISLID